VKYAKYGTMVLMLALFVGFSTPQAAAQQAFVGSFDLPAETYWGSTLLAPGHYTINMSLDPTQQIRALRIQGDDRRVFLLSGPPTPDRVSDRNVLRLENINGVNVVRHLDAGLLGQSYVFPVAKSVRVQVHRASTSTPAQTVVVPVSAGGSY
jgi:hypothetical protein